MSYVMKALKDRRESYHTSASGLTQSLPLDEIVAIKGYFLPFESLILGRMRMG
jgi:hypothetical protein